MNDAGVAPPGVMPIQQPTATERRNSFQCLSSSPQVLPHHLEVDLRALALEGQALFHGEQDLADAEQADHRDQEAEALEQFR